MKDGKWRSAQERTPSPGTYSRRAVREPFAFCFPPFAFRCLVRRVAQTAKNKNKPGAKAARARSRWKVWLALAALLVALLVCLVYGFWASSFDMREVMDMTERSAVYDMDGKVYSRLPGQNRVTVKLAQVSPYFVKALLSREDSRFYQHQASIPSASCGRSFAT